MTNAKFAQRDVVFQKACEIANVEPTQRQASKFRAGKGAARRFLGTAASWVKRQK